MSRPLSGSTDLLLKHQAVEDIAMVYLCGNYGMILEAMDILRTKGIRENQMHAEVYF
jgi:ferredoxin-NADP reductase